MNNQAYNGMEVNFCDTLTNVAKAEPFAKYDFYHVGKTLPDRGEAGTMRSTPLSGDNIAVGLLVLMFCIIAVVTGHYRHFLLYRIKGFFTQKRTYTEESADINRNEVTNTIMLTGIAATSLALIGLNTDRLAGQSIEVGGLELTLHSAIAAISLGTLLFIGAKSLVYHIVNSVFFHHESNGKWLSSYYLLTSLMAYVLYPLALVFTFNKTSDSVIAFCLLFALILYKILLFYKLCTNFETKKSGILLFFLYFCSVEIMPTLILAHIGANI